MSVLSEIHQEIKTATYEAAGSGRPFTIITFRIHRDKIKLYRLAEKSGYWIVCGLDKIKNQLKIAGNNFDLLIVDDVYIWEHQLKSGSKIEY